MVRAKPLRAVMALFALLGLSGAASADPVRVVEGYIQVSLVSTDFVFRTSADVGYAGELEMTPLPPILSGMSGDLVNLSSTLSEPLTGFAVSAPDRVEFFARADLEFTGGTTRVPPLADAMAEVDGVNVFAPFTFTGSLTTFSSRADAMANLNPLARHDLFGQGTAQTRFRVQMTDSGQRQPELPLISNSIIYRFGEDPAPVPEPGTLLLLACGLAATAARVRSRRSNTT